MSHFRAPRICLLSAEHGPDDKRVFQKEARSLARAGFDVVHLCPGTGGREESSSGVRTRTYRRRQGKLARLLALPRLFRLARRANADAYHCNEPDSWVVGVLLRLLLGKVVVFDCHEHYPGQVVHWLWPSCRRAGAWLTRVTMQFLGLFTHRIVLAKYSVARDLSWSQKRHVVVLNTTPLEALRRQRAQAGSQVDRKAEAFTFVHIGVIRRERGSQELLAAMRLLAERGRRDYRVLIIGEFRDGSEQEFFAKADELGVHDQIEFHRWMEFDDAFRMVCQSHAGLILFQRTRANNVFGMPHKMFDYMLAGLPVIAPDFATDIVSVLEESQAGLLIDTADAQKLADTMMALMDDRDLAAEIGRCGQRAVHDRYNWEQEARKLVAMYRQLLRTDVAELQLERAA